MSFCAARVSSRLGQATLLLLVAAFPAFPQQIPYLATGWRVVATEAERVRADMPEGVVGLLEDEIRHSGWRVADQASGPGELVVGTEGRVRVILARPALLVIGGSPERTRARLDDWMDLQVLSARPGGSVVLLPPGRHALRIWEEPVLRNLLAWWTSVAGAAIFAALAALLLHRLVAATDRWQGSSPAPVPVRPLLSVLLICGLAWSWILVLEPVASDYPMATAVGDQVTGTIWGAGEIREAAYAEIIGDKRFFRPVYSTLYFLELAAFGPSGFWLHLMALLWHLGNVALLFTILHRFLPTGAALGALLGGLWPVAAGQTLTWLYTRQLPMTLFFGLGALLLGQRYLRGGRATSIAGCAALLWLACGTKESGVLHVGLVPLFAPMFLLPSWRPRRTLALWGSAVAVAALYFGVRLCFGYGVLQGYAGLTYRTPLHLFLEAAENLAYVFAGAFALTNIDSAHGLPCWIAAGALAILAALAGRRALCVVLLALLYATVAILPDAQWMRGTWCAPSLSRGLYIIALVGWGVLAAAALSGGLARASSRLRVVPWGLVVILCAATAIGHHAEWGLRGELARVASKWVRQTASEAAEHERDAAAPGSPSALSGPCGLVVVGNPVPPELEGKGVIIGPSLAASIAPPFASRRWKGISVATWDQARASTFIARYPWELVVLASDERRDPPHFVRRLPCLRGTLPVEASLEKHEDTHFTATWSFGLGDVPPREVLSMMLSADAELPAGTRIVLWHSGTGALTRELTATRLQVSRLPGRPIRLPTARLPGWLDLEPGARLAISLDLPGGSPAPALRLRLEEEVGRLEVVAPRAGSEIPLGALLPPIRWRDSGQCETYHLTLGAEERHRPSGFSRAVVPMPRAALQPQPTPGGEELTVDLFAHFGLPAAAWTARVAQAEATHRNFDGLWLLLELRGTIGEPPWIQSTSPVVLIKLRF